MYRTLGLALLIITLSFSGCQETEPSRVIVSLQIDSDGEDNWLYLYTIPRVKMDNLTISINDNNDTLSSVFSHQKNFSNDNIELDSDGYFVLKVSADLSNVFWEYLCKLRIYTNEEDGLIYAEVSHNIEEIENLESWPLPYNVPLEYRL